MVRAGDTASVDCVAESGDAPIRLAWLVTHFMHYLISNFWRELRIPTQILRTKEGEARLPGNVDVAGGLLRFAAIDQSDGGRYTCEARNAAGTARATAEVIVQGKLCIMQFAILSVQCTYHTLFCLCLYSDVSLSSISAKHVQGPLFYFLVLVW